MEGNPVVSNSREPSRRGSLSETEKKAAVIGAAQKEGSVEDLKAENFEQYAREEPHKRRKSEEVKELSQALANEAKKQLDTRQHSRRPSVDNKLELKTEAGQHARRPSVDQKTEQKTDSAHPLLHHAPELVTRRSSADHGKTSHGSRRGSLVPADSKNLPAVTNTAGSVAQTTVDAQSNVAISSTAADALRREKREQRAKRNAEKVARNELIRKNNDEKKKLNEKLQEEHAAKKKKGGLFKMFKNLGEVKLHELEKEHVLEESSDEKEDEKAALAKQAQAHPATPAVDAKTNTKPAPTKAPESVKTPGAPVPEQARSAAGASPNLGLDSSPSAGVSTKQPVTEKKDEKSGNGKECSGDESDENEAKAALKATKRGKQARPGENAKEAKQAKEEKKAPTLTREQQERHAECKLLFEEYDADRSGSLDQAEMKNLLISELGYNFTEDFLENIIEAIFHQIRGGKKDQSKVNLEEFIKFFDTFLQIYKSVCSTLTIKLNDVLHPKPPKEELASLVKEMLPCVTFDTKTKHLIYEEVDDFIKKLAELQHAEETQEKQASIERETAKRQFITPATPATPTQDEAAAEEQEKETSEQFALRRQRELEEEDEKKARALVEARDAALEDALRAEQRKAAARARMLDGSKENEKEKDNEKQKEIEKEIENVPVDDNIPESGSEEDSEKTGKTAAVPATTGGDRSSPAAGGSSTEIPSLTSAGGKQAKAPITAPSAVVKKAADSAPANTTSAQKKKRKKKKKARVSSSSSSSSSSSTSSDQERNSRRADRGLVSGGGGETTRKAPRAGKSDRRASAEPESNYSPRPRSMRPALTVEVPESAARDGRGFRAAPTHSVNWRSPRDESAERDYERGSRPFERASDSAPAHAVLAAMRARADDLRAGSSGGGLQMTVSDVAKMVVTLQREDEDYIKRAFQLFLTHFDTDGDGRLGLNELGAAFRAMGMNPSADDVANLFRRVDLNQDGSVDLDEFKVYYEEMFLDHLKANVGAWLHELLRRMGVGDGLISPHVFSAVLTQGEAMSARDVGLLLRFLDADGDGSLYALEFVEVVTMIVLDALRLKEVKRDEQLRKAKSPRAASQPSSFPPTDLADPATGADEDALVQEMGTLLVLRMLRALLPSPWEFMTLFADLPPSFVPSALARQEKRGPSLAQLLSPVQDDSGLLFKDFRLLPGSSLLAPIPAPDGAFPDLRWQTAHGQTRAFPREPARLVYSWQLEVQAVANVPLPRDHLCDQIISFRVRLCLMRARSDTALSNVLTLPANVNKDTGNWSLAPSLRKVLLKTDEPAVKLKLEFTFVLLKPASSKPGYESAMGKTNARSQQLTDCIDDYVEVSCGFAVIDLEEELERAVAETRDAKANKRAQPKVLKVPLSGGSLEAPLPLSAEKTKARGNQGLFRGMLQRAGRDATQCQVELTPASLIRRESSEQLAYLPVNVVLCEEHCGVLRMTRELLADELLRQPQPFRHHGALQASATALLLPILDEHDMLVLLTELWAGELKDKKTQKLEKSDPKAFRSAFQQLVLRMHPARACTLDVRPPLILGVNDISRTNRTKAIMALPPHEAFARDGMMGDSKGSASSDAMLGYHADSLKHMLFFEPFHTDELVYNPWARTEDVQREQYWRQVTGQADEHEMRRQF